MGHFCHKKLHHFYPRYGPLGNFFFSVGNSIFFVYNFNTATHGGLKNQNLVPQPPQQSPVSSVTIVGNRTYTS
jgi:hypothetical protein